MTALVQTPVTGLVPPQLAEARIRETWPSVSRFGGIASLGQALTRTILLAPLAWLIMALPYFAKVLPFSMCRYLLTNRRVAVRRGWSGKITQEVPLAQIDDVTLVTDSNSEFFRSGNLEIKSGGQTTLTLVGVRDPETFRQAILNARNAWVPEKAKTLPFISSSAK
jgi:hypothetical protein